MMDIDELLSIIENPTRRRILESIVREPSYPLQLSKDIGVSQQAVMKNLSLMEDLGMIMSYREASNMGPMRTLYVPNTEFTLMVDMHDNMFTARLISIRNPDEEGFERTLSQLKEIDEKIKVLEKERNRLLAQRKEIADRLELMAENDMEKKAKLEETESTIEKEV